MGSPEQAIERIKVFKEIGITQVAMLVDFGSLDQKEIMRSLEIFGKEVLPHVRDL
jgi:alkanesulfonate monooxygenase SsuD/methylene tetrahydromethanopterin reductase-like flavin-dependent oxidoreductase (luciferase family)